MGNTLPFWLIAPAWPGVAGQQSQSEPPSGPPSGALLWGVDSVLWGGTPLTWG